MDDFEIRQVTISADETKPYTVFDNDKKEEDKNKIVKILNIEGTKDTIFKLNNGGEIQMEFYGVYELDLDAIGGDLNKIEIYSANSEVIVNMVIAIKGGTV